MGKDVSKLKRPFRKTILFGGYMKKIISFFLFVFLLIPCVFVFAGAQTADHGETVTVEITIPENKKIQAGAIEFVYDADVFEFQSGEWKLASKPMIQNVNLANSQGVFAYGSGKTVSGTFIATFVIKEGAAYTEHSIQTTLFLTKADDDSTRVDIEVPVFTVSIVCSHANVTEVPYQAPTCEAIGYTEGTFCEDCKVYLTGHEEIPTIACDFSAEVIEDAYFAEAKSCTHGDLYYKSCTMCGKKGSETFENGEALGHTGGEPTCSTQAVCTRCGEGYGDTLPHTLSDAATCLTAQICTVCEKVIQDALGHDYESVVTAPTCTKEGYTTHTCKRCGDVSVNTQVAPLGHDYAGVPTAPTCTEKGYVTYTCNACSDTYVGDYSDPFGHAMMEEIKAPTCTEQGYTLHFCTRCTDESYKDSFVDPIGHQYSDETFAPTCTEKGYVAHTCENCQDVYKDNEVDALGHDYESAVTAPTCLEKGYTTHTCKRCQDTYTDTEVDALGHDFEAIVTDPTCLEKGYTTHICKRCKDTYTDAEVDALGHDYESVVTAPTCTETGLTTHTCKRCEDVYEDAKTDALGHDYEDVVTAPTCTEDGFTTHTCKVCKEVSVDTEVEALGHTYDHDTDADCNVCGDIREVESESTAGTTTGTTISTQAPSKDDSNDHGSIASKLGCKSALSGSLALIFITCGAAIALIRKKKD